MLSRNLRILSSIFLVLTYSFSLQGESYLVGNPFTNKKVAKTYLASIKIRGVPQEKVRLIPTALLERYSPALAAQVHYYRQMSTEQREKTLKTYTSALRFFLKDANQRMVTQKYINDYASRFEFLHEDPTKGELLLDYMDRQFKVFEKNPNGYKFSTALISNRGLPQRARGSGRT